MLADRTRTSASEIERTVENVQKETTQTIAAIDSNKKSVEQGQSRTAEAHKMLTRIIEHAAETQSLAEATAAAAKAQSAASNEIAHNAELVAELAAGSLQCSIALSSTVEHIRASARSLSETVHQFKL